MHAGYRRTPSARFEYEAFATALFEIIEDFVPDMILPSCEEVFYLAHALARGGKSELLFAPDFELLAKVHNKAIFAVLAKDLGYGAERNRLLTSRLDVEAFADDPSQFVFKPVWSRFASRVLIGPAASELKTLAPTPETPWLAQSRILGDEICAYCVFHRGRPVAAATYRGLARAGKGTSIVFKPIEAPDVMAFLTAFADKTQWHGQISFDFIREVKSNRLVVIEANPRATSGVHFFTPADNLPAAIIEGTPARVTDMRTQAVKGLTWLYGMAALFGRSPKAPYFRNLIVAKDAYHFPGDGSRLFGQARAMGEVGSIARRYRVKMQEATTYDMEWNGQPPGSERA
jgi:hypothetical protein